jgi:large subunit ribosomal protein L13
MKTYSTKPSEVRRTWHVLDAENVPLGRLATQAATLIRGKHKPTFAPHLDTGDYVIVVNAAKVAMTGRKMEQKLYYRHSGYPGGLKTRSVREETAVDPRRVVEYAVFGMLPKTTLGKHLHGHLKVYPGPEHPHAAQVNGPAQPALSQPPQTPRRKTRAAGGTAAARAAATATRTAPVAAATPSAVASEEASAGAREELLEEQQQASATSATGLIAEEHVDQPEESTAGAQADEQQGEE